MPFSSGISDISKHESYTSAAIPGAQGCLAESERGGEIRAASGVNISLVKMILWVMVIKCRHGLINIWTYHWYCNITLDIVFNSAHRSSIN